MRLIDVSEAKKFLKENLVLPEKEFETIVNTMLDVVPTAYDPDKVVEQLESINTDNSCGDCKYRNKCDDLQEIYNPADSVDLCGLTMKYLAIEIVKAGGVNENG